LDNFSREHRKSSNHAGTIAGIAVGIAALIITILVGILFCIGWRRRRTRAILAPASYLESTSSHGLSLPNTTADSEKQAGGPHFITIGRRSSRAAERRQEYLNNRIRVAQRELDAMNDTVSTSSLDREGDGVPSLEEAKQQIQALQENISMLQRRLQSQWALGVSDEPPPEYME
jgi:phosphatidylserine/phosphatidylglycerophosphate/cardiolipin synthase-like enzyme